MHCNKYANADLERHAKDLDSKKTEWVIKSNPADEF